MDTLATVPTVPPAAGPDRGLAAIRCPDDGAAGVTLAEFELMVAKAPVATTTAAVPAAMEMVSFRENTATQYPTRS